MKSSTRRWLNPLRFLCAFGWHRNDGYIDVSSLAGTAYYRVVRHCGRCYRPW